MQLNDIPKELKECPKFKMPTYTQALIFLMSELGEVADAVTGMWYEKFTRSEEHKWAELEANQVVLELADVVVMAAIMAEAVGGDLDDMLQRKMEILKRRFSSSNYMQSALQGCPTESST